MARRSDRDSVRRLRKRVFEINAETVINGKWIDGVVGQTRDRSPKRLRHLSPG